MLIDRTLKALTIFGAALGCALATEAQSIDLSDRFSTRFQSSEKSERVKVGSVKLRGRFEVEAGSTDNVFRDEDMTTSDVFLDVYASANARTSDEFKTLSLTALASSRFHQNEDSADQSRAAFVGYGRFNLRDRTQLETISIYRIRDRAKEDERDERNLRFSPLDQQLNSDLFLTQAFGDAAFTLRAGIQRSLFEDTIRNDGAELIRSDADNLRYDGRARGSYNVSDELSLFGELGVNAWDFDAAIDRNGIQRGSEGGHIAIGAFFEPSTTLKGEIAIGAREQTFADDRFDTITFATLDGWLRWRPAKRFETNIWAETTFEEETVSDRAGTVTRSVNLHSEYYLTDRWRAATRWQYRHDDNIGNEIDDEAWRANLGLDYELRPGVLSSLEFGRRTYMDGDDRNSFTANEVLVSLKLNK